MTASNQRDLRGSAEFQEAQALFESLRRPGTGLLSDIADVHASYDGRYAAFAGFLMDTLEGLPKSRITLTDLSSGDTRLLTFGPNTDRAPRFSPDAREIAFVSDRAQPGNFQLYRLDLASGAATAAATVNGWIEYLHWSPDGRRILLGVAGHGSHLSSGQGATASAPVSAGLPPWTPMLEAGCDEHQWRGVRIYDCRTDSVRSQFARELNVWEATWCGNDHIAVVASKEPSEGSWYGAHVSLIDIRTGEVRTVFEPRDQIGVPAGSPTGDCIALVEAVCSDRAIIAGELRLIELSSGQVRSVHTSGIDVSHVEWLSAGTLLLAGHRGFETVIARYERGSGSMFELWSSTHLSTAGRHATVAGSTASGDCVLVTEGFANAPELGVIRERQYRAVKSFDLGCEGLASAIGAVERLTWRSCDELDIQGWLLRPPTIAPHPLVMVIHGGPVWQWRPTWLGRSHVYIPMLLRRGYAIFLPNPRGSTGRGVEFARRVCSDLGGADAQDLLSGLDSLLERQVAHPNRLGVMGTSYGGYMTTWLTTRDRRFGAAIAIAPHTNFVTEYLLSNIPQFVRLFLGDSYTDPAGPYFTRSSIMHAHQSRTPMLSICGELDRCTPPEEAMQFHRALRDCGCPSVLVTYPREGHGVKGFPAIVDFTARVVSWFEEHLSAPRKVYEK